MGNTQILSDAYQRLSVINTDTGEEIAAVTNDNDTPITTASENIVVKLMPKYN